jgi:hypothetical protein
MLLREKAKELNPMIPLGIGCSCTVLFLGLDRFASGPAAVDFLVGMFSGMSVVLNVWGLWLYGRQRRLR